MRSFSFPVKVCFCAAACAALLAPPARGTGWKFNTSFNYDTGKYGTSDRTDSIYIPFTLKRYYQDGDFSVTVPYLRQSSTGQVVRVGGNPVRVTKRGTASAVTSSESGPGDILVRGGYVLKKEAPRSFDLTLAGSLKLPTADKNKGLGTGEMDEGMGLEFAKKVSPRWTLLADCYYTIIGAPPGTNFNSQLSFDIGFSRPFAGGHGFTLLYETRSALVSGNSDARDISGTLDYKSPDGNHYIGGLLLGLSDGSPDIGISAGLSRRF